jgi:hypothetical protein
VGFQALGRRLYRQYTRRPATIVRDRFLYHVSDIKEQHVPNLLNWILKQCDLNKDVEIDSTAQLTFPDIQLKSADRVFRLYVKVIKDKAYCRGEESLTLNQILPEALDNIRHPYKSLEKKIDYIIELRERALRKQGLFRDGL